MTRPGEQAWARREDLAEVTREDGDGVVVYVAALPDGAPLVFEGSAALVWLALDEPGTTAQVANRVVEGSDLTVDDVLADVCGFIDRLAAARLVHPLSPPPAG